MGKSVLVGLYLVICSQRVAIVLGTIIVRKSQGTDKGVGSLLLKFNSPRTTNLDSQPSRRAEAAAFSNNS